MEILAEILFLLLQLLFEVFGEIILELGLSGLKEAFGRENRSPILATLGYLLLGAIVGGLSILLWPMRIIGSSTIPGISLVAGPLAGGAAMEAWGRWRRKRGHDTTNLATFYGGGAFALAFAIVRLVWAK